MKSRRLLVPLVLLLVPCALGQFGNPDKTGNVRVRVVFENGRQCRIRAHVVVMTGAGTSPVADAFTNDECMVGFDNLMVGDYHLRVSGEGIQDTDSGLFEVDSRKTSQFLYVIVKLTEDAEKTGAEKSNTPTVSAADLNIPHKAVKEFDKASAEIANDNWKKAQELLLKALAIYPQYAAAYNNLGVVYGRLGNQAQEREALEKAIQLDDHFAPAFANLAKMAIRDRNFPAAEEWLNKAVNLEPTNAQTLMLLANVELLDGRFDDAIIHCHKVHSLQHPSEALVHYIAARAMERENRPAEAVTELHTFLVEEPSGPRADAVRKEMAVLEGHPN